MEKTIIRMDKFPNHLILVIKKLCCVFVLRSWCFAWLDEAPVALLNCYWSAVNTHMQDYRCHMACRQKTFWGSEMGTHTVVRQSLLTGIQRIRGSEHQEAWKMDIAYQNGSDERKVYILFQVWSKFVLNDPIDKTLSCVYMMALLRANNKTLYEPMLIKFCEAKERHYLCYLLGSIIDPQTQYGVTCTQKRTCVHTGTEIWKSSTFVADTSIIRVKLFNTMDTDALDPCDVTPPKSWHWLYKTCCRLP